MTLTFLTWLWRPPDGYRSAFRPEHVRILRNMLARNYLKPANFVVVTDQPEAIDPDMQTIRLWSDYSDLASPHGGRNPSCYRRLKLFSPEAAQIFGSDRLVSLDLDTVIVRDVTPVFDRPEEFVAFGETDHRSFYNGSFLMLTAGARRQVWDVFTKNPQAAIQDARSKNRFGSDQAIISNVLEQGEAVWRPADGVYSFRVHLENGQKPLPSNARLVSFHGGTDPWSVRAQALDWVREHYC